MAVYICTLYEGSYHLGVGALINSLCCNGFRGTVYVGVRGDLPPWAQPLREDDNFDEFMATDNCNVKFVKINTQFHLANYKPTFMLRIIEEFLHEDDVLCYFDPDITLKCKWSFFKEWVQYGIGLVEDCTFPRLPSNHPLRLGWLQVAKTLDLVECRQLNRYYNSGYVGISAKYKEALILWDRIITASENFGFDPKDFTSSDRTSLWQAADQDHLNVMIMTTTFPLSTLGPDGMDFAPGGYVMSHAVNSPKPWVKNFVRGALKGYPPTLAEKNYWSHVQMPIRLFDRATVQRKKLEINIGLAIGRFMRRS